MLPRFHVPALGAAGDEVALPLEEARHLVRVLRLGAGDEVVVFDGRGREFRARVTGARKDAARVQLLEALAPIAEPRVRLTLVQAMLKGDAMDDVVRDATMLGASAIVPIVSAHVVVKGRGVDAGRAVERWQRVALASAKQCRRATLPSVGAPVPFEAWLKLGSDDVRWLLVEPSAQACSRSLREWSTQPPPRTVSLIVGPEGGWSSDEIAAARAAGCEPVSLGSLTLRANAVAVAALSVCRFVLGEF